MESSSKVDDRLPPAGVDPAWEMVSPISPAEVAKHLQGMNDGAAGP